MQLLLFDDAIEEKKERKIYELEEKYHILRKSQHARISMLNKELKDMKSKLDFLESKICKDGLFL